MSPEEKEKTYRIFLKWYAMPKDAREPREVDEFCAHLGIDRSLLSEFTSRDEYTDDLYRESIAWGKSKVPEMLHILYARYKESHNPNDLRMYKELLNLDKAATKKEDSAETSRNGVLRELFQASRP